MATSETAIANLALQKMGQSLISSIDGTSVNEKKAANIFDQVRDETLIDGPELGWKFSRLTYHGIDDHSATVSSIAVLVAASTITVTTSASHGLVAGDMVELAGDTGYDGTYDVVSVVDSGTFTFVVAATFVATGTGTAHWRSERYTYRYAIPTSKKVTAVKVGGIELTDWVQEGDYVLTNMESDEVDMDIINVLTTTVTAWPDWFVRIVVLRMAIELHYSMTQDLKAIQLLAEELYTAKSKAIAMDERQKYVKEESSSWQDIGNITQTIE